MDNFQKNWSYDLIKHCHQNWWVIHVNEKPYNIILFCLRVIVNENEKVCAYVHACVRMYECLQGWSGQFGKIYFGLTFDHSAILGALLDACS